MPRLTTNAWLEVRAKREAGLTFPVLAAEYGVDKAAICRRAKREEWADGDGLAGVFRQKVNAKVNRIDTANKVTRLATIDAAADRAVVIINRHREDWRRHYELFPIDTVAQDSNLARLAKLAAEMLCIRQKGERAAWGLEEERRIEIKGLGVGDCELAAKQAWDDLRRIHDERAAAAGDDPYIEVDA